MDAKTFAEQRIEKVNKTAKDAPLLTLADIQRQREVESLVATIEAWEASQWHPVTLETEIPIADYLVKLSDGDCDVAKYMGKPYGTHFWRGAATYQDGGYTPSRVIAYRELPRVKNEDL